MESGTGQRRNVISGNLADGVRISGAGAIDTIVAGNYIGTDVNGRDTTVAGIGNGGAGVSANSSSPLIHNNLISNNHGNGITVAGVGNGIDASAIAWFKGDDATDSLGDNDGTALGGVTFASGLSGQAFDFDGVNGRVVVPDNVALDSPSVTNQVTLEAWINWDGTAQPYSNPIVRKTVTPIQAPYSTYSLDVLNDGRIGFQVGDGIDGGVSAFTISTAAIQQETWTHIAATYDGVTQRIYVDGTLIHENLASVAIGDSDGELVIGRDFPNGGNQFDGRIDELAVYDKALSPVQIAAIHEMNGVGKQGVLIDANIIGLNPTGTSGFGNSRHGVEINDSPGNIIGENLISGNAEGVLLTGSATSYNVVRDNKIGTDVSGTLSIPNAVDGVGIRAGAHHNYIGTDGDGANDALEGNLISGNAGVGIEIAGASSTDNVVSGNYIGTDATGTAGLLPEGTRAWFQGEGDATDAVGLNDGILLGDAAFASGLVGQAFSLDGAGDYVNFGSSTDFDVDDFMIDAWVFIDPVNNTGDQRIVSRDDGFEEFALTSSTASLEAAGKPSFRIGRGGSADIIASNTALTAGWHHIAGGRYLDTEVLFPQEVIVLFVDGALAAVGGTSISGTLSPAAPLVVGTISPSEQTEFFRGLVDEVALTNRLLDPAEIQAIFDNGSIGRRIASNALQGVQIADGASDNLIGGSSVATRNVISANLSNGIVITGSGTTGNTIAGNFIGTNAAGTSSVPNRRTGVVTADNANGNTIGGVDVANRNLVSGNALNGIGINSDNNFVQNNYIGTDVTGTVGIGNAVNGIFVGNGASNNAISSANVISANGGNGIRILGADVTGNTIASNFIGTDISGTLPLAMVSVG